MCNTRIVDTCNQQCALQVHMCTCIAESCFEKRRGRRCIVVSIVFVLLYFNCGIVAISKNYRKEEEDDERFILLIVVIMGVK